MKLYKFVPTREIAQSVSAGIYRFYELTKYLHLEESTGRSDCSEGSIKFINREIEAHFNKLPVASFNEINFHCSYVSPDDDYLSQYYIFCMSTQSNGRVIDDCQYAVELDTDIFDIFEMILSTPEISTSAFTRTKFFSHSLVEYYDIHKHPTPFNGRQWREVYIKRSEFSYQHEYRAALFASAYFFDRIKKQPLLIERSIRDANRQALPFPLKVQISSGVDVAGWRYVEFDVSEFQSNLLHRPVPVLVLNE